MLKGMFKIGPKESKKEAKVWAFKIDWRFRTSLDSFTLPTAEVDHAFPPLHVHDAEASGEEGLGAIGLPPSIKGKYYFFPCSRWDTQVPTV